MFKQNTGFQGVMKDGGKHFSGVDEVLLKNIEACKNLAQITRTSLGPSGTSKLIINHLSKHFVTSDTGTMVRELEVMHPAAKMIVLATEAQTYECGDATNFVVTFAGALLHEAEELLKEGIHAADILKGYELANKKVVDWLEQLTCWTLEDFQSEEQLTKAVVTAISAKQLGYETDLAPLLAKAVLQVLPEDKKKFDVDNVRVAKIPGGSLSKSFVIQGMVITRDVITTVRKKEKCKVAIYGGGLQAPEMETKGTVLLENADALIKYSKGEEDKMEEFIKGIVGAGVQVIISGGAVSEIALHFLNKYDIMCVKVTSKFELQRFCKTLGATSIIRAGAPLPEELGYADSVHVEEIASQKITIIRTKDSKVSTIVLRGGTGNTVDEWERALDDGTQIIRGAVKDPRFVAGGGAAEMALASKLQAFGQTVPGLDQYAVLKFAEALEVVPRMLAENSGHNRMETITALHAEHKKGNSTMGVNIEELNGLQDCAANGILDHLRTKSWALRLAVDAVLTVIRVDQIIMAKQAGGPKGGGDGGRDLD
eukprot:GEMP01017840.1.p1 GENE.GEMP01017840.1~~GEMP01017840.1.p1  ORF type:complete len:540 (+),score=157.15 GEMP01017840.1:103-1722(+)